MDKLKEILASIFGPAIALRAIGCLLLVAWVINTFPSVADFLRISEAFKKEIFSFCFYVIGGSQIAPFFLSKGKDVTGGTKPITPEASDRVEMDKP